MPHTLEIGLVQAPQPEEGQESLRGGERLKRVGGAPRKAILRDGEDGTSWINPLQVDPNTPPAGECDEGMPPGVRRVKLE